MRFVEGARVHVDGQPVTELALQTDDIIVSVATVLATIYLYLIVPKGFFPVQDTGVILGISDAPQTISFDAMSQRQLELNRVILKDPAVESLSSFIFGLNNSGGGFPACTRTVGMPVNRAAIATRTCSPNG